jgi:dGTPase
MYTGLAPKQERHETIRRIINTLATDLTDATAARLATTKPADIDAVRAHPEALVGYSDAVASENRVLKRFLRENLYHHHRVYRVMVKARRVVRDLFEALFQDARLMPPEYFTESQRKEASQGEAGRARAVADYIAGMTDRYALDEHERLYDPRRLK